MKTIKKTKVLTCLAVLILALGLGGCGVVDKLGQQVLNGEKEADERAGGGTEEEKNDETEIPQITDYKDDNLLILRNGEIWSLDLSEDKYKQLTDTKNLIDYFVLSPDRKKIAFVKLHELNFGSEKEIIKNSLHLLDLNTNEIKQLIYPLDKVDLDYNNYHDPGLNFSSYIGLASPIFSADGSKIFFWRKGLQQYNILTKELSTVVAYEAGKFCSVQYPKFISFDNNFLAIAQLCFEGYNEKIIDLENKKVVFDGGHVGGSVSGFIPNSSIAIIDNTKKNNPWGGTEITPDDKTVISFYDLKNDEQIKKFLDFSEIPIEYSPSDSAIIHIIEKELNYYKITEKYNLEKKYNFLLRDDELYRPTVSNDQNLVLLLDASSDLSSPDSNYYIIYSLTDGKLIKSIENAKQIMWF